MRTITVLLSIFAVGCTAEGGQHSPSEASGVVGSWSQRDAASRGWSGVETIGLVNAKTDCAFERVFTAFEVEADCADCLLTLRVFATAFEVSGDACEADPSGGSDFTDYLTFVPAEDTLDGGLVLVAAAGDDAWTPYSYGVLTAEGLSYELQPWSAPEDLHVFDPDQIRDLPQPPLDL